MPTVQNQDITIAFEDTGAGPPLILSHSFLCSGDMWREQVAALRSNFRVINVDFRGHGRSGPVPRAFSLYDAVTDLVAVLDALEIGEATWCGLSIGGMLALRAALTCPERVSRLLLLDTDAGPESAYHKVKYGAMGFAAGIVGIRPFLPIVAGLMFGATTIRTNPALVAEWKTRFAGVHVPSIQHCLQALVTRDSLLDRLERIQVPALVLVGAEDRSLPPPHSERIHERLPHSTMRLIPGAGHLAALEQPAAVNSALLEFLRSGA